MDFPPYLLTNYSAVRQQCEQNVREYYKKSGLSRNDDHFQDSHCCRLKDVTELFYDTGIGKEGYSIIGQGQIEKILNGKPEERRELF